MTPTATCVSRLVNSFCQPVFRGGIVANCKRFKFVGSGYASMPKEQNGHFEIQSARHLAGIFHALEDPFVRCVHLIGATQVLKSMAGECWIVYHFEHFRLPTLVLFEDEDKARKFASERLISTVMEHPGMSGAIVEQQKDNRFKITQTKIKLPGASLFVEGLNEGNVSTFSWPIIWVSEAWQHGSDGLLPKAFKRADRFPDTHKILNESQASLTETDLHRAVSGAHPVPLIWRCPACDGAQTWEWHHWSFKRPENFKPRAQKHSFNDPPKPLSYGGMDWSLDDPNATDRRTIEEKARSAHWHCIHCDYEIEDTADSREAIAETYSQTYVIRDGDGKRTPKEVYFTLPYESNKDNRFEKTVKKYIDAKHAKENGNPIPMQDWFLQDRAFFYEEKQDYTQRQILVPGSYETNPDNLSFGEQFHCRQMTVDTGKAMDAGIRESRVGTFWFVVRDWSKRGDSRQMARGFVDSWELLAAQQKFWKVPCPQVLIDCAWMQPQVEDACRKFFQIEFIGPNKMPVVRTWRLIHGQDSGKRLTIGNKGVSFIESRLPGIRSGYDDSGKLWKMFLYKVMWTNLWFEQQLDSILASALGIKFEWLTREKLIIVGLDGKPSESLTAESLRREDEKNTGYFDQLNSRYFSDKSKKYEDYEKQSRPTEFRDCELEQLVGVASDGLLGNVAPVEEKEQ